MSNFFPFLTPQLFFGCMLIVVFMKMMQKLAGGCVRRIIFLKKICTKGGFRILDTSVSAPCTHISREG